jgi:hypothetical protein
MLEAELLEACRTVVLCCQGKWRLILVVKLTCARVVVDYAGVLLPMCANDASSLYKPCSVEASKVAVVLSYVVDAAGVHPLGGQDLQAIPLSIR